MLLALFVISLAGGFLSGLLGIGGAVILIPMMLSVPPLFGAGTLSMKTAAGISMMQVLASSSAGTMIHKKNKNIDLKIMRDIGIPMGMCALAGAFVSKHMNNTSVGIVFIFLASSAFLLMIRDGKRRTNFDVQEKKAGIFFCISIGVVSGFLSGIAGVGGGFILIPLMTLFMHIPIKKAVGTSLGIVFVGALFGSAGKLMTFQVEYAYIIPAVAGSILASRAGARLSCRLSPQRLRFILLTVIFLSIIQSALKILNII